MTSNAVVDAVFVTYNPDISLLEKGVNSLSHQVRCVYIIDNSPDGFMDENIRAKYANVKLVCLSCNKGIAYAQNIGIKKSIENMSDFIVLCDQDTIFPATYINQMVSSFQIESKSNLCAMAPTFKDTIANDKVEGGVCFTRFGFCKIFPKNGLHHISQAIASGLLIETSCLDKIGYMDEDLFIDWVDIEWCWRAISKGYIILWNADVLIEHCLGDEAINLKFRHVNLRSPIRHYYITRNAFYLATRCNHIDFWHKFALFIKSFRYIAGFTLFAKPHIGNFKFTMLGFYHGLIGRLGKF